MAVGIQVGIQGVFSDRPSAKSYRRHACLYAKSAHRKAIAIDIDSCHSKSTIT
jgi:hypothetical protein